MKRTESEILQRIYIRMKWLCVHGTNRDVSSLDDEDLFYLDRIMDKDGLPISFEEFHNKISFLVKTEETKEAVEEKTGILPEKEELALMQQKFAVSEEIAKDPLKLTKIIMGNFHKTQVIIKEANGG